MELKAGARLRSTVCETQVIVVRAPSDAGVELWCGGSPMVGLDDSAAAGNPDPAHQKGTVLGKRYVDESSGLEVLCTKGGEGSLSNKGEELALQQAKPLPASD